MNDYITRLRSLLGIAIAMAEANGHNKRLDSINGAIHELEWWAVHPGRYDGEFCLYVGRIRKVLTKFSKDERLCRGAQAIRREADDVLSDLEHWKRTEVRAA